MQAYAIFDGGGVKGAALAGAFKAAQDSHIEFVGFGGTSAGSIVALLATLGYAGDELEHVMTEDLALRDLAHELKVPLKAVPNIMKALASPGLFLGPKLMAHRGVFRTLSADLGFSSGKKLSENIYKLVVRKFSQLKRDFTFHDLAKLGRPPLKIVASDVRERKPLIFSAAGKDELGGSVLEAVRASMSYPFAFKPVRVSERYLVDGGLCSNLPVFLFDEERDEDRLPLLAFDLVPEPQPFSENYGLRQFSLDMLETSLEAGDYLMRRSSQDVHHIQIRVPGDITALDFDIPKERLQDLFHRGSAATHEYIQRELSIWQQAESQIEALQARHGSPEDVRFVLERFANHVESATSLTNVRTHIMMPTRWDRRTIIYHYNMDEDTDQDLSLSQDGGCSGKCWTTKSPTYADLVDAGTGDNYVKWKMTKQEQLKVKKDRKTMLSIPVFAPGSSERLIGVLSADSDVHLRVGTDDDEDIERALAIGQSWAVVFTAVLA
jgi:NTE family protein